MENLEIKKNESQETDIAFSKTVLAGKRIYFLDAKKNRKDELYLIITESKRVMSEDMPQPVVQYKKQKIFLYKEDFDKFVNALNETLGYIKDNNTV